MIGGRLAWRCAEADIRGPALTAIAPAHRLPPALFDPQLARGDRTHGVPSAWRAGAVGRGAGRPPPAVGGLRGGRCLAARPAHQRRPAPARQTLALGRPVPCRPSHTLHQFIVLLLAVLLAFAAAAPKQRRRLAAADEAGEASESGEAFAVAGEAVAASSEAGEAGEGRQQNRGGRRPRLFLFPIPFLTPSNPSNSRRGLRSG